MKIPWRLERIELVVAVAAFEKHGGPCIVVDFGTATTFDAVSSKGEYLRWGDSSGNSDFCRGPLP